MKRFRVSRLRVIGAALILLPAALRRPDIEEPVLGVSADLNLPLSYLALSPFTRLYDEVTLLDSVQLAFLIGTFLILGLIWMARRFFCRACPWRRTIFGVGDASVVALVIAGWLVIGAIVPRPMASLAITDPALLTVDFHSHTSDSHDGRWGWDAEANRAWHAQAGFDAAYVSDHQTMRAWQELADRNALAPTTPPVLRAGFLDLNTTRRVTLLPAIETVIPNAGAHVNLLGVRGSHSSWFGHRRDLDVAAYSATRATDTQAPLVLLTLPYDPSEKVLRHSPIDAIEGVDASPKGLRFARTHAERIRVLADSLGVPRVASSNHHGWGSTAAAWTVLRLPGWSALGPQALDSAIRATLRTRPSDVSLVQRRAVPPAGAVITEAAIVPGLLWHTLVQLQPLERLSWCAWMLLLGSFWARRRATKAALASR